MRAYLNGPVLIDGAFAEGRAVLAEGGRIAAVVPAADVPAAAERIDLAGDALVPGFIDTQVNGGGGVLFNDDPTVEAIAAIGAAHRPFGTTGFLPTLISDDLAVIRRAVDAVDRAIAAGVPGVLGIHIEGPFLNATRRGIHREDKIRTLDEAGLAELTRLRNGRTLVTLAPELVGPDAIRRLVAAGVTVAGGHTAASYEEAQAAIAAGMTGVTHLFNAMAPLGHRAPGLAGAVLERPDIVAGLIVDGRHVHPAMLRVALRCRPLAGFMLVTDAMPSVGGPKSFTLQGRRISARDGVCIDDQGTLAGSDLDMGQAVRNAITMAGLDPAAAVTLATASPAAFLALDDVGAIRVGARADFVRLDGAHRIVAVYGG